MKKHARRFLRMVTLVTLWEPSSRSTARSRFLQARSARSPGLLVLINVTDIKAHGTGPKVQALPVATGAVGEATEGKLVRIRATPRRAST